MFLITELLWDTLYVLTLAIQAILTEIFALAIPEKFFTPPLFFLPFLPLTCTGKEKKKKMTRECPTLHVLATSLHVPRTQNILEESNQYHLSSCSWYLDCRRTIFFLPIWAIWSRIAVSVWSHKVSLAHWTLHGLSPANMRKKKKKLPEKANCIKNFKNMQEKHPEK